FIPNPYIHAITSTKHFNEENKHNNLIQLTTQAMSSILGGSDALSISNYDAQDNHLVRLSTNIQNMLRYESYLDNYREAANGSFYIETVTAQLAEKAWKLFQEIESDGGFLESWKNGKIKL
ncbi:MAG: methylmalonyl-CoA mutase, partial [Fimbriimonadaceae bacterium]|nr:methylmalonyl-CoA mutase [Chitinophagales bacterium]